MRDTVKLNLVVSDEEAIRILESASENRPWKTVTKFEVAYDMAVFALKEREKIVRCSECVNHAGSSGKHYCKFWRMNCPDDSEFFCKAGERKGGDMNG